MVINSGDLKYSIFSCSNRCTSLRFLQSILERKSLALFTLADTSSSFFDAKKYRLRCCSLSNALDSPKAWEIPIKSAIRLNSKQTPLFCFLPWVTCNRYSSQQDNLIKRSARSCILYGSNAGESEQSMVSLFLRYRKQHYSSINN